MTQTDRLLANAADYPSRYGVHLDKTAAPVLGVAIVACMDARIDMFAIFGLGIGDSHIIRNAGGLVTDDALRSLAISQRFLGTREIILLHHTGCGLHGLDDDKLVADLEAETGRRPTWRAGGFTDPAEDVRRSMAAIMSDPYIPVKESVRGFVFDVFTGGVEEVQP